MYQNPILYADYSDPDVIRVGEDYYMVASSFTYFPGVPILHSKDLVHWHIINYAVPALPFEKYDAPSHGSGTWAPSIRYHGGVFYVFVPLPDEGIFVARSEDIYGEFRLNCLQEAKGWIDPCPYWDDDGRAYMVFAYARSRCGIKHRLSLVEIDPDCTHIIGEPKLVFHKEAIAPTIEGPKLYRHEGFYYIFAPAGGVAEGWQAVLHSENIWGPYDYRVVLRQGSTAVNGPHQGGWITAPDGKHWFIHFQDVGALGRITHLQPMIFRDGWPVMGKDGEPVAEYELPADGMPRYEIATSDDFSSPKLGLQWQWQATPMQKFYSLRQPGLRLYCLKNERRENLLWYAPNALTQIPQHKAFSAAVKLKLHSHQSGDLAALGFIGHCYAYLALEKGLLRLYRGKVTEPMFEGAAEEKLDAEQPIAAEMLYLKVTLENSGDYRFFYSLDGESYLPIGGSYPLTQATWTGAKLCLWAANRENRKSDGFGDFAYIQIEKGKNHE